MTTAHYQDDSVTVWHGKCLDVLRTMPDSSIDSIVTDPPYGLSQITSAQIADVITAWVTGDREAMPTGRGFMGAEWDVFVPPPAVWDECLRVLKPGGHLLAFAGSRTVDLMTLGLRLAGFDIRDSHAWLYGSGMPKSHNLDGEWQGWGTGLKPSHEPIVCARKPFSMVPLDWRLVATVHHALAGLLWLSLSPAKRAELTSPSSPAGHSEAWCASARVSAAMDTSRDGYAETDTFSSQALASTSLSIASSWSATLAALSDPTTMSTTSTASSTTTALRTLNSLLAPLTSQTTMPPCGCLLGGPSSSATSADATSTDEWARWLHTLSASVPETATEGIALAVASALAQVAESLSADLEVASSATPSATTGAAANGSPAFEPIVVARKPLAGTVAANVQEHGTGALNIDATRTPTSDKLGGGSMSRGQIMSDGWHRPWMDDPEAVAANAARSRASVARSEELGRWPANVILDESQAAVLDAQSGTSTSRDSGPRVGAAGDGWGMTATGAEHDDTGGASRFFYVAKADTAERPKVGGVAHPTVKPLSLMQWLVRLVTPPGGVVLDPYAGSGTTAEACIIERFRCVVIEREDDHLPLILARIHRQRDPIAHTKLVGDDLGLFGLLEDEVS